MCSKTSVVNYFILKPCRGGTIREPHLAHEFQLRIRELFLRRNVTDVISVRTKKAPTLLRTCHDIDPFSNSTSVFEHPLIPSKNTVVSHAGGSEASTCLNTLLEIGASAYTPWDCVGRYRKQIISLQVSSTRWIFVTSPRPHRECHTDVNPNRRRRTERLMESKR
jgi:hypothetical protein